MFELPYQILLSDKICTTAWPEWNHGSGQWTLGTRIHWEPVDIVFPIASNQCLWVKMYLEYTSEEDGGSSSNNTKVIAQHEAARRSFEIIIGDPSWCDYIVEADLKNVGNRSWGHPGIIFHAQDVNNYEVIYFRPHSFHSGMHRTRLLLWSKHVNFFSWFGSPCFVFVTGIQHGFKADQVVMSTSSAATVPHDSWCVILLLSLLSLLCSLTCTCGLGFPFFMNDDSRVLHTDTLYLGSSSYYYNRFHVKVVVCSSEGFGRVYIDDMQKPSLVFALKFSNGCVGFFQYEQKGLFRNLLVRKLPNLPHSIEWMNERTNKRMNEWMNSFNGMNECIKTTTQKKKKERKEKMECLVSSFSKT